MCQKTQTPNDARLWGALSNMRYKACTPDDIAFLRSRISSELDGRPCINSKQFRNVSIITTLNLPKDVINDLGSQRFAAEANQELVFFYSEDTVSSTDDRAQSSSKKKSFMKLGHKQVQIPSLSPALQQTLWNLPPSSNTKNIPGKLTLCHGLPVIIRLNSATELYMTKGQNAIIYDWQMTEGSKGQCMLDTLFMKLVNPPQIVQLDNLPENVVPLTRTITNTQCVLPNDATINISRSQVEVLPNFAMTDYTSQGKTRPFNVVDLSSARSHQSYYTALSRSASAAGTVILQGFDTYKITGGASGALRQEFRELEMLDDITTLHYNGKLPISVVGNSRNELISTFCLVKGEKYVPSNVHRAIRWKDNDPFHLSDSTEANWKTVVSSKPIAAYQKKSEVSRFVPAKGTKDITVVLGKRKFSAEFDHKEDENALKKIKTVLSSTFGYFAPDDKTAQKKSNMGSNSLHGHSTQMSPHGTQWSNNSCAFDAVMSILYNIWQDNTVVQAIHFKDINNELLGQISDSFSQTRPQGTAYSLEDVCDFVR
jgi:hypothetical protein